MGRGRGSLTAAKAKDGGRECTGGHERRLNVSVYVVLHRQ